MRAAHGLLLVVAAWVGVVPTPAQAAEPRGEGASAALEAIREDVEQARFEKALGAIEALLGRTDLTADERAAALVLRVQSHVGFGDLAAAEKDFREILLLRPAYVPDESLTPAKALQRFAKVQASMIGRLRVALDPPDARLLVDEAEVRPDSSGTVHLLAGEHRLRAERAGFDPDERTLTVGAGTDQELRFALVPNARAVVLRTDLEGVRVRLDGVEVGVTARPDGEPASAPAELVLESVPLGEHAIELSKECHTSAWIKDTLSVDLMDRSPRIYPTVRLRPASSRLVLRGDGAAAEVRLDGKPIGRFPAPEALEVCPGRHLVEIVVADRTVWRETVDLAESEESIGAVAARPNLSLVGPHDVHTAAAAFAGRFNVVERRPLPAGADLSRAEPWLGIPFPQGVDLALAVEPGRRPGDADRWYLFSPILRRVAPLPAAPGEFARPGYRAVSWGLRVVDSSLVPTPLVVEVLPGSTAERAGLRPGDRIVSADDREIQSRAELHAVLENASVERTVHVAWLAAGDGATKEADLRGQAGPRLAAERADVATAAVTAAFAAVDSIAAPSDAPTALADLGLLLLEAGLPELAERAWRRVSWGDRSGIGEGTRLYHLGRCLEAQGRDAEAAALFRQAAASGARAHDDDGPAIAPAARDRLADLGVAGVSAR